MIPSLHAIAEAAERLHGITAVTPLEYHARLSQQYGCNIYLKREDRQVVRSYKIRGAYNLLSSLTVEERARGVVCASAGNHAQGVAYSCCKLGIQGDIFMPANTPGQKVAGVRKWGGDSVRIFLEGETFDDCCAAAELHREANDKVFVHPFDDVRIIEGQATVSMEISEQLDRVDFVFLPVGGGGLAAGAGSWFSAYSPSTELVGAEPAGASSMRAAWDAGGPLPLEKIDPFVDGAAVRKVGKLNYDICRQTMQHLVSVPEGKVCATMLSMYNEEGIVLEPAGALSLAALDEFADIILGKTVVCITSGSNNDSLRMDEIQKLADAWEGLHHHLMIRFQHRPDGLAQLFELFGAHHYVTRLKYERREHGRSTWGLVSIKSLSQGDYMTLVDRMEEQRIEFREVRKEDFLFKYLI